MAFHSLTSKDLGLDIKLGGELLSSAGASTDTETPPGTEQRWVSFIIMGTYSKLSEKGALP